MYKCMCRVNVSNNSKSSVTYSDSIYTSSFFKYCNNCLLFDGWVGPFHLMIYFLTYFFLNAVDYFISVNKDLFIPKIYYA